MLDLDERLSRNFTLVEFLRSETAERQPPLLQQQYNPPEQVVNNLRYLCSHALQPIREALAYPLRISSGYRCKGVNELIGSTERSQHRSGQAADCQLADEFLTDPRTETIRKDIQQAVLAKTGKPIRNDVNANYYLFAYVCLHLETLDVDQAIHEYGRGPGRPAWVHIAASPGTGGKQQIVALGNYVSDDQRRPDLVTALNFGTAA